MFHKGFSFISCLMLIFSMTALEQQPLPKMLPERLATILNYWLPSIVITTISDYFGQPYQPWKKTDEWSVTKRPLHHIVCHENSVFALDSSYLTIKDMTSKKLTTVHLHLTECATRENYIFIDTERNGLSYLASTVGRPNNKTLHIYATNHLKYKPCPISIAKSEQYQKIQECYRSHGCALAVTHKSSLKISLWKYGIMGPQESHIYREKPIVELLAVSSNGKYVVAVTKDKYAWAPQTIEMWYQKRTLFPIPYEHYESDNPIRCIAISNKGKISFATPTQWKICKNSTPDETNPHGLFYKLPTLDTDPSYSCNNIQSLQFSPNGELIVAVSSSDPNIQIRNSDTHEIIDDAQNINMFSKIARAYTAVFTSDSKKLIIAYNDGVMRAFMSTCTDSTLDQTQNT